jgi:hypothetical protein
MWKLEYAKNVFDFPTLGVILQGVIRTISVIGTDNYYYYSFKKSLNLSCNRHSLEQSHYTGSGPLVPNSSARASSNGPPAIN